MATIAQENIFFLCKLTVYLLHYRIDEEIEKKYVLSREKVTNRHISECQ